MPLHGRKSSFLRTSPPLLTSVTQLVQGVQSTRENIAKGEPKTSEVGRERHYPERSAAHVQDGWICMRLGARIPDTQHAHEYRTRYAHEYRPRSQIRSTLRVGQIFPICVGLEVRRLRALRQEAFRTFKRWSERGPDT